MKVLLRMLPLLALLASCSKNDDPAVATDPFLGHWQSKTLRNVAYDASGKVTSDETTTVSSELDVSTTTITFTSTRSNGTKSTEVNQYVRNGENITVTPPSGNTGNETVYVRSLTPASFTFEFNGKSGAARTSYQQTIPYTR